MSAFDVTLNTLPIQLAVPGEDEARSGANVEILAPVAIPFPTGNGIMALPMGILRIPIERDHAIQFGEKLVEEAKKLPVPSKLEVATNLAGVERAAEEIQGFRDGKPGTTA